VIVNTHSPAVVQQVPEDALLVAEPREVFHADMRFVGVRFSCLPGTWRAKSPESHVCKMGDLLAYLSPVIRHEDDAVESIVGQQSPTGKARKIRRVVDRPDVAPYFPGLEPV
jgi:hypothetical protein